MYPTNYSHREVSNMGEIIISILIGGCMFVAGVLLRVSLGKEAKKSAK
jgi:hypothetical protein